MMRQLSDYKNSFDECSQAIKGGQKKVYKVKRGNNYYAFKIINECKDVRVLQEIDILKNLNIKGVPKIIEYGELLDDDGDVILYILEEYICENSLRKRVDDKNFFNLKEAYMLIKDLLLIEIELEKHGIIHRDIKPDNILITENRETYLIDFGVAKVLANASLTAVGNLYAPHTPGYAPSEQVMNDRMQINSKTDLYQIGITLYELIKGANPFLNNSKDYEEIRNRTMNLIPEPLIINGDTLGMFSEYISMLMAKQQSQRPANARKALDYLETIFDSLEMEG